MLWFSMLGQHRPHKVCGGVSLFGLRPTCTVSELDSRALCIAGRDLVMARGGGRR